MSCAFGSAAEIAECIIVAKDWGASIWPLIQVFDFVIGGGTFAFVSLLAWYLSKARKQIEKTEETANELRKTSQVLRATADKAMEEKTTAEADARLANKNLNQLHDEFRRIRKPVNDQLDQLTAANNTLEQKLDAIRNASSEINDGFWGRTPTIRLQIYAQKMSKSIPVLLFANQKGGVGKTTLSANLAACFAQRGERVLAIDLDYQGSLSGLMLSQAGERPDKFPSTVELLHKEPLNDLWPSAAIQTASKNLDYISCWYSFERMERNLEYLWLLGETNDDIRFRLARAVLSDHVQSNYDRVIIDAPPRMTTGFLNGFCASTHLFVPTVVDRVSAVAVGGFADRFSILKPTLNPVIEFAGLIGTMTTVNYIPQQAQSAALLAENLVRKRLNTNKDFLLRNAVMRRTPDIPYSTDAGIPYLQNPQTHPMFDKIADEIARRAPLRT